MLIGLTGRIGCGKGFIVEDLKDFEFSFAVFSDVLREEAIKRGILITRENLQNLGDEIRRKEGGGALVKRILEKIDLSKNYIFDGLRNPREVEELRKTKKFILIAVHSDRIIRWGRLEQRKNEKDPKTWEDFVKDDLRDSGRAQPEYGQQVDKCMQLADFHVINNSNLENLKKQVEDILNRIKEKC